MGIISQLNNRDLSAAAGNNLGYPYSYRTGPITTPYNEIYHNSSKDTELKPMLSLNGKEYNIYRDSSSNFYILQNGTKKYLTPAYIEAHKGTLNSTNMVSIRATDDSFINNNYTSSTNNKTQETEQVKENTGGGGTTSSTSPSDAYYANLIKDLNDRIYELEHPRVYSADEIAEHYGIQDQYNEQFWLDLLNKETNDYYNAAIDEQSKLRSQYTRNNNQYLNRIVNSYLDSYRNAAPTATGRGTLAANLLSTQIGGGLSNAENDYGMLQSINALGEARKQELANNPNSARQRYNTLGTYLSDISVTKHQDDVNQYIAGLKSLASDYAADRAYQAYLAQAAKDKYSGLASASISNAGTVANNFNSNSSTFQNLWDYYYNTSNKNATAASNQVATNINNSVGRVIGKS